MTLLHLAVVALVVALCGGVYGWLTYERLGRDAEDQALAIARAVAGTDDIREAVAEVTAAGPEALDPEALARGPLQSDAEDIRRRTQALFVVIYDEDGLRLSHPNPAQLGQRVSTDPSEPLAGREFTGQARGTLGRSARAKVPVYAPGSSTEVIGGVNVGFSRADVFASLEEDIAPVAATAVLALGLGAAASAAIARRLKRLTLGLEPEEIVTLAQDQEAVLRGVDEGVIGVSPEHRITVVNAEAGRLLGVAEPSRLVGTPLAEAGLPASFPALLAAATPASPAVEQVVGRHVLILSARAVLPARPGLPPLGWVVLVRDRTELQSLTRQLDAVGALSTALRAQRHEFANRLHTISGLLAIGDAGEARRYVSEVTETGPLSYPAERAELLRDPYLQAFLGAKSVEAAERGVSLRIGADTLVRGRITDPQDVTTVIGSLVDNAVRAAVQGEAEDRWVEVELLDDWSGGEGTLHLVVADSGDGLPVQDPEPIFAQGWSTAVPSGGSGDGDGQQFDVLPDVHGQGFGLSLSRELARRRDGDVWVADPGRPGGPGAVFCARLPGTVVRDPGAGADARGEPSARGSGGAG
ncbi:sensor histidine kinase [uncultured Kocuria sp.]|uniref:sensor histidine kinase n=1 Tax=uncultured Kocuria sp. TaxID=259305 RepID=UPI002619C0B8|nr:sensor histidine kinase [uncultured Kocuria sp.]